LFGLSDTPVGALSKRPHYRRTPPEFRHDVHFSQAAMRDPSRSVSHFLARLSL
jgi:hypothetical protein